MVWDENGGLVLARSMPPMYTYHEGLDLYFRLPDFLELILFHVLQPCQHAPNVSN